MQQPYMWGPTNWELVDPLPLQTTAAQWISPTDDKIPLRGEDRGGSWKQFMSISSSLISHKSIQWQTSLVSNKELSVIYHFASIYLFPMPISTHMSLLSVLPGYCSISLQHIWQVKAKAAVFYILFLLFKVCIPAKWILSQPKTPAGVPCYKSVSFSISSTWRTKDLQAL